MVWPWGSSDSTSEAVKNLDPSLREFLEREAPKPAPPLPQARQTYKEFVFPTATAGDATPDNPDTPKAPPKSLYQDGRYAHLWKTYADPMTFEEKKTDQERLQDLVESFHGRKRQLSKAALENCAFEHIDQYDCLKSPPTVSDRMNMCRDYTKRLDRCFMMQGRFLRALGYAAIVERDADEEERIQMHADKLFREMLEHERLVQEAKDRGEAAPELRPIMSKENVAKAMGVWKPATSKLSELQMADPMRSLNPEKRAAFEQSLVGKSLEERALMEREMEANIRTALVGREEAADIFEEEKLARRARREKGHETFGDKIKKWWGWRT